SAYLPLSLLLLQRLDLLVGVVLAQGIDRPQGGGDPADEGDLEDEADDAGEGAADGEEQKPGQDEGDQKAHVDCIPLSLRISGRGGVTPPARVTCGRLRRLPAPLPPDAYRPPAAGTEFQFPPHPAGA